jgi:hypothetical protein
MARARSDHGCHLCRLGLVSAASALVCLAGSCTSVIHGGPKPPTYEEKAVAQLIAKYAAPGAIPTDPKKLTPDDRNRIIEDLVYLVDVNYRKFEGEIFAGRATFDTSLDLALLGLGGAGALISASGTQAILAAISGGLSGTRVSINKNFFREQSTHALVSTMRATRKTRLDLIRGAEVLSLSDYPMSRALADVSNYYDAGTVLGALERIVSEAGQKEQEATNALQKKLEDKIEMQYKTEPLRERIKRWLLANDTKRVPEFVQWLKDKDPPVTISPVFWIMDANTTEADLLEAIAHFKIPE